MAVNLYCVPHAREELLVGAVSVARGCSVCADHALADVPVKPLPASGRAPACSWCDRSARRAYFVVRNRPGCIRHAADATFEADDMGAHNMAHAAYLALRAAGVTDAY